MFPQKIGVILIEVACKNENVVVVSEALDCIFDVFKEDHTDGLVQEIGLVDKLKSLEPTFKNKVNITKSSNAFVNVTLSYIFDGTFGF